MKNSVFIGFVLKLFVVICSVGCTVKADRAECPCLLSLSVSGGDERIMDVQLWSSSKNESTRVCLDGDSAVAEMLAPKGEVTICAMSGVHSCTQQGTVLLVDKGNEMDELYAHSINVDAQGDKVEACLTLHRQFAFAYLAVSGVTLDNYPYYLSVEGNVCGVDLRTMDPVPGEFSVLIHPYLGKYHRICLPRQKDGSLTLQFYNKDFTKTENAPAESLPLGKYILKSGYDWQQEDLKDIYIDVDYVSADITINVLPWEKIEY